MRADLPALLVDGGVAQRHLGADWGRPRRPSGRSPPTRSSRPSFPPTSAAGSVRPVHRVTMPGRSTTAGRPSDDRSPARGRDLPVEQAAAAIPLGTGHHRRVGQVCRSVHARRATRRERQHGLDRRRPGSPSAASKRALTASRNAAMEVRLAPIISSARRSVPLCSSSRRRGPLPARGRRRSSTHPRCAQRGRWRHRPWTCATPRAPWPSPPRSGEVALAAICAAWTSAALRASSITPARSASPARGSPRPRRGQRPSAPGTAPGCVEPAQPSSARLIPPSIASAGPPASS